MLRPLLTGITFCSFVLASSVVGCDFLSRNARDSIGRETVSVKAATPSFGSYTALEKSVYQQIDRYRQSHNLPPLKLDPRISHQAQAHSQEMANGRVPFGHQGFEQRVKAIDRFVSYRAAAENVAYNQGFSDPASEAVRGWIKSNEHRINIEGQYDLTGIGVAKNAKNEYYFTQIFIRRF